jgi:transposase
MASAQQEYRHTKFTREALDSLSKERLIDIILRQQEQIETLMARVEVLQAHVEDLKRRLEMNSQNSSKPPSTDGPDAKPRKRKDGGKRKPGGQQGHEGHHRDLLPVEKVTTVVPVKPCTCEHCGRKLKDGEDPHPERHQVWEIPEIQPDVVEYQLHGLWCDACGEFTKASLPEGVPDGAFGPRLTATIAILSGVYRLSKRSIESILADFFHIPMSLGSICGCEADASAALAQPVHKAVEAAQAAQVLHADETSWRENNKKRWLWVAVTSVATVFMIGHRTQEMARELLGTFVGVLVTDRCGAYNIYGGLRQWCWAHLCRDFTGFSELKGKAGEIGHALLAKTDQMFHWWHRVRDGTMKRSTFQHYMRGLRAEVEALLREGMICGNRKMERSCKLIFKGAKYLWTFVDVEGVEPTNNAGERGIRPGVQWRKDSFGTHSAEGSRFVERIMTAAATCRQHGRNVTEYVTEACTARLHGHPAPSLLPTVKAI